MNNVVQECVILNLFQNLYDSIFRLMDPEINSG